MQAFKSKKTARNISRFKVKQQAENKRENIQRTSSKCNEQKISEKESKKLLIFVFW